MRLPYLFLTILLVVNALIDGYIYLAMRSYLRKRIWSRIQGWTAILFAALLIVIMCMPVRSASNATLVTVMWMLFAYVSVYIPKYLFFLCDVLSRLPMLFKRARWKWMTGLGVGLGLLTFIAMWWGALVTRLSTDTVEVTFTDARLPEAFDGIRIVQLSDMHLGTHGNDTAFVSRVVDRVNELNPDLILFTGDLVNRNSTEAEPFVHTLSRLHARYGVFSVMGNHDYGDYEDWPSDQAKAANRAMMDSLQAAMGWTKLDNDSRNIIVKGDTLTLIGVENIGDPPFHVYGDLQKAYPTVGDSRYKILMSHNPVHWDADIEDNDTTNIALTLSGHTHAMQTRVLGFSPSSARYPHWGGMYEDKRDQRLYVNIGLGTVGYPARIGATPEITLITIRRK